MAQEREEREKGRAEGLAEGRAEGARDKAVETAAKLKALGVANNLISQGTGLTEEEIERL